MSKKTITKETTVCDLCGANAEYAPKCLKCGKEFCYDCAKKRGTTYRHAVHFSGSGDGFYCNPCDTQLAASGTDTKHNAYVAILMLRKEADLFYKDFQNRRDEVEKHLRELI